MNRCTRCGGELLIEFEGEEDRFEGDQESFSWGTITCCECVLRWKFKRVEDAEKDDDE